MPVKYDVIIVGAGPAGLTAARVLSKGGLKVAIFEKDRHLGTKPCGEAVSKQTLEDAMIAPSRDFIAQEIKCATIYAPNGKGISIKDEAAAGYVMNKKLFLQRLAEKAVEEGVDFFINHAVVDLRREGNIVIVKSSREEYKARLVIGADGFASTVSSKFGFESSKIREVIPCLQYVMVNCNLDDPQTIEFYLGNEVAPLGYAYIFPKGNRTANVGIGVRGRPTTPYLNKFLKNNSTIFDKARVVGIEAAVVTISGLLDETVNDNVMLVGEAAGQVIPLTGGGIHSSIVGGKFAGETALEAIEEDDLSRNRLEQYSERFNEHWGKRIRDSLKALRVLEKLSDEDFNKLVDLLEPNDILDLANGFNIARVGRKFLRHPLFSLKLARALLSA